MLKYLLLGFLNYDPQTGYELKQVMDISTSNFWHAKQSQIYITLKKLKEDGLLTSEVEPQEGRPNRRVYTITPAGQEAFQQWLAKPLTQLPPRKEELLTKLFFAAPMGKETLLTQLRLQRDLHQEQVEVYKNKTKEFIDSIVSDRPQLGQDALLWEAARRFGELYEEMYIQWLDETIATVEKEF